MTGDLFMTRYADCIFNGDHFSTLGGENLNIIQNARKKIGMINPSDPQIYVHKRLNFKFRK
jgi:hypothetical protein